MSQRNQILDAIRAGGYLDCGRTSDSGRGYSLPCRSVRCMTAHNRIMIFGSKNEGTYVIGRRRRGNRSLSNSRVRTPSV
jgi:hypothetical protein